MVLKDTLEDTWFFEASPSPGLKWNRGSHQFSFSLHLTHRCLSDQEAKCFKPEVESLHGRGECWIARLYQARLSGRTLGAGLLVQTLAQPLSSCMARDHDFTSAVLAFHLCGLANIVIPEPYGFLQGLDELITKINDSHLWKEFMHYV